MGKEQYIDVSISIPRGITAEYFKDKLGVDLSSLIGGETQGNEVPAEQNEEPSQSKI